MGIACFTPEGKYVDSFEVKVGDGVISSKRLYFMRLAFEKKWEERFGKECIATLCVTEHLPPGNWQVLNYAAGAILASGKVSATLDKSCYIAPPSWKSFARANGCRLQQPKGWEALKSMGWEYPQPPGEDACDAVLLYLTSVFFRQQVLWFGPNRWISSWFVPKTYVKKEAKVKEKRSGKASKVLGLL